MSDHSNRAGEAPEAEFVAVKQKEEHSAEHNDPIARISGNFLDRSDSIIYAIVGMCFLLGAFFTLGYSFWDFGNSMLTISDTAIRESATPQAVVAETIIKLVSDLLLVLIIMEVLSTVIHYLKAHATSLRPFLFIGIVSATRGILSIGARLSIETAIKKEDFINAMIELGVNAAVILALGITLKLLGKLVED